MPSGGLRFAKLRSVWTSLSCHGFTDFLEIVIVYTEGHFSRGCGVTMKLKNGRAVNHPSRAASYRGILGYNAVHHTPQSQYKVTLGGDG